LGQFPEAARTQKEFVIWLCLSNSFLSIVAHYDDPNKLLVRARVKGHIEAVFPDAKVYQRKGSDYLYRADIPREVVAKVIGERLTDIDYSNFKNSVKNRALHDAYAGFWTIMYGLQSKLARSQRRRKTRPNPPTMANPGESFDTA
jgi:hypothetical protein